MDSKELKVEKIRRLTEESLRTYYIKPEDVEFIKGGGFIRPNAPSYKQYLFHKSKAKIRGLFGGNQSGKSWAKNNELAMTVGKIHPYRPNYVGPVFARDCYQNEDVLEKVAIPTYMRILPRQSCILEGKTFEGKPRIWPGLRGGSWGSAYDRQFHVIYLADGSFIEFKTYQQGERNLQSFAGPPRHIVGHDEEPRKDIYEENKARQNTLGMNQLFAMTPLQYSKWLYTEIYEKASSTDSIDVFEMSAYENPIADHEAVKDLEDSIEDPAIRAARIYGKFTYVEGLVYKGFSKLNIVDPFTPRLDWEYSFCIDPHLEKPTAWNLFGEDHLGNIWCIDEGNFKGDVEFICQQIRNKCGGKRIGLQLIDPSSRQSTGIHGKGRLIDVFREYFPELIEADNDVLAGIDRVKYFLKNNPGTGPKLKFFSNCTTTIHQMKNLSWKPPTKTGEDRRRPEVVKKDDDNADNVRYRVMAQHEEVGVGFTGFGVGIYGS